MIGAYSAPQTRAAGALITSAIWNQDVVANPIAIFAGAMSIASQAANEIIFASSTTQLSRSASLTWDGTVLTATNIAPSGAAAATPTIGRLYSDSIVNAWVHVTFSAGTPSIDDDFNVASLTDNGIGDVTVTFATALATAKYAAVGTTETSGANTISFQVRATTSIRTKMEDDGGGTVDDPFSAIVVGP